MHLGRKHYDQCDCAAVHSEQHPCSQGHPAVLSGCVGCPRGELAPYTQDSLPCSSSSRVMCTHRAISDAAVVGMHTQQGLLNADGQKTLSSLAFLVFGPCLNFTTLAASLTPARLVHWWPLLANMVIRYKPATQPPYLPPWTQSPPNCDTGWSPQASLQRPTHSPSCPALPCPALPATALASA